MAQIRVKPATLSFTVLTLASGAACIPAVADIVPESVRIQQNAKRAYFQKPVVPIDRGNAHHRDLGSSGGDGNRRAGCHRRSRARPYRRTSVQWNASIGLPASRAPRRQNGPRFTMPSMTPFKTAMRASYAFERHATAFPHASRVFNQAHCENPECRHAVPSRQATSPLRRAWRATLLLTQGIIPANRLFGRRTRFGAVNRRISFRPSER